MPWWLMLALVLALAVTARGEDARSVRVPLLLLGGGLGLLVLLPGMRGPAGALAFVQAFLTVMGGTALVYLGVSALEGRRFAWGAGWLAALLLLGSVLPGGPSPLGLAVGLLALTVTLLGAAGLEDRPPLRLGGSRRAVLGAVSAGLAVAALLALLALALPGRPVERHSAAPQVTAQAPAGVATPTGPARSGSATAAPSRVGRRLPASRRDPLPGADLVLLGGLLLMLALAFMAWRAGGLRLGGRRFRWWEVAAVLSVLLTAALLFVFGLAVRSGDAALPPGTAAGPASAASAARQALGEDRDPLSAFWERWLWATSLLTFVVCALLAGAVFWLALHLRREPEEAAPAPTPPELPPPAQEGALHRVRLAYRAALASLSAAGLGRSGAETPAEHAGRAASALPLLAAPLGTLVAAYAPVRYGGRVTDDDAEAAERAAQDVAHLTAGLRLNTEPPESETP